MSSKYTEAFFIRVEPSLKAALENLLLLSSRAEFPTMGDLLRDILSSEAQKRLKKITKSKESECDCPEIQQIHTCGKKDQQ